MKTDPALIEKSIQTALLLEIKRSNFDYFERAVMMQHLLDEEKKRSHTLGEGRVSDMVADRWCIGRKELYRCMAVLKCNARTKRLIKSGAITADKVSRIMYSLVDKSKEDELVDKAIREQLNSTELERSVSEVNDPDLMVTHLERDVDKMLKALEKYSVKAAQLNQKNKSNALNVLSKASIVLMQLREKFK